MYLFEQRHDEHERSEALSAACGKGHFITAPATLLPKVSIRVNLLVAEPSVPALVLNIFDGAGWGMTVKISVVFYF